MVSETVLFWIIGFIVQAVVLTAGGIWQLVRVRDAILKQIAEEREHSDGECQRIRREFGEVASAIRQKVADVETNLWKKIAAVEIFTRDEFVRERSFTTVVNSLGNQISSWGDKLEARLMRIENKVNSPHVGKDS